MSIVTRTARARRISAAALILPVAVSVGVVAAQSLGEVARREQARRKTVGSSPGKVYSNDRLRPEPAPSAGAVPTAPSPPAATAPQEASKPAASAPPAAGTPAPESASGPGDEKAWRERMKGLREAIARNRMFAEALQSRINGLSADFTSRDDPAQRAAIAADRDKALAEMNRVKAEMQQQDKALVDAQETARRAGVPSGWLRE
jgi:hypothetical protein